MKATCLDCGKEIEQDDELCVVGIKGIPECFCPHSYADSCPNDQPEPQQGRSDGAG